MRMEDKTIPFQGKGYDREALAELVKKLIEGNHVRDVFGSADVLALADSADQQGALDELKQAFGRRLNLAELKKEIKRKQRSSAREKLGAQSGDLPLVKIGKRKLRDVAHEIMGHLNAENAPEKLFVRDTTLARVRTNGIGQTVLQDVDELLLTNIIENTVTCFTVGRNEDGETEAQPCTPPRDVVRFILGESSWPFPVVEAVTMSPIVRPDGTIWATPGYDPVTHMIYAPGPDYSMPEIPDAPTQEDAHAAYLRIIEVLSDIPFKDRRTGLANALAFSLTMLLRSAIDGPVPLLAIDGTRMESSKTLLGSILCVIGSGQKIAQIAHMQSWPNDAAEQRKTLESELINGSSLVIFDNVRGIILSTTLESMITADAFSTRIMATNRKPSLAVHAVWMLIGNGMRVGGDMPRRTYWVHLDAGTSHERRRPQSSYKIPFIKTYINEHRGELVAAALTMIRAWYAAGCPDAEGLPSFGSFEQWTRTIGGVLAYAGVPGFLSTQEGDMAGADEETEQWEPFLLAWHRTYGDTPMLVNDVAAAMEALPDGPRSDMAQTLPAYLDKEYGKPGNGFRAALGTALRSRDGRRYGQSGVRIENAGKDAHKKAVQWRAVLDEGGTPQPEPEDTHAEASSAARATGRADTSAAQSTAAPRSQDVSTPYGQRTYLQEPHPVGPCPCCGEVGWKWNGPKIGWVCYPCDKPWDGNTWQGQGGAA